jgi:hypothetical protein
MSVYCPTKVSSVVQVASNRSCSACVMAALLSLATVGGCFVNGVIGVEAAPAAPANEPWATIGVELLYRRRNRSSGALFCGEAVVVG